MLQDGTALVTGAGRGIGRAVAVELAEMGVRSGLVARSEGQLAATAAQVRGFGARAVVLPVAPESMIGGNAYVTAKSALEAHTLNLAPELAASGVTVNAYRPGSVATPMQEWIRDQEPASVGGGLVERFRSQYEAGALISPETSARALVSHLAGNETGQIWGGSGRS